MPEMDGFQLMDELQALDPEMDVILMTGSVHEIDAKLTGRLGKMRSTFFRSHSTAGCFSVW